MFTCRLSYEAPHGVIGHWCLTLPHSTIFQLYRYIDHDGKFLLVEEIGLLEAIQRP
jgi:hypothetical protein